MLTLERIAQTREKLRERVWYAAIMPDGGGVAGRNDALDALVHFEIKVEALRRRRRDAEAALAAIIEEVLSADPK